MKSIAFFDVDYTLVAGNSGFYTSLNLVRHKILKKRRMAQAVYYLLAATLFDQDVRKIYQIAVTDLAGCTLEHVLEIGRETFDAKVKPKIYTEGLSLVADHKKRGDAVVLLTSAPYMLIHSLQNYLKADEAYSMGPVIQNGILTRDLALPICHADGKIHYAKEASKKYGIPLSECFFYTDHHTDIPLLKLVGNSRVVNPGHRLEKEAIRRGWPMLRFRETLGKM